MNATLTSFFDWLDNSLAILGWNDKQLARKAGLSPSVLSKARNGYQGIGWEAAIAIAQALDVPATIVLRKLELLPPEEAAPTPEEEEILAMFKRLDERDQDDLAQFARIKLKRKKKSNRHDSG